MSDNPAGGPPREDDPYASGGTPPQPATPPAGGEPVAPPDPAQPPYGQQPPAAPPYGQPAAGQQPPYGQQPAYGQQQPPQYGQYGQPAQPGGYPPPGGFPTAPPAGAGGYGQPAYGPGYAGSPLTVGSALGYGWSRFTSSMGWWILQLVVLAVLSGIVYSIFSAPLRNALGDLGDLSDPQAVQDALASVNTFGAAVLSAVATLIVFVLRATLVAGAITTTRQGRVRFGDFWKLTNVGAVVLIAVIVGVLDLVLAFVPLIGPLVSLLVQFFLTFAVFFAMDKGQDAITAIRSSFAIVSQNAGAVLLLILAAFGLNALGLLACGIGLLFTIPWTVVAFGYAYRRLVNEQPA